MAIQFELYKTPRPKDEADKETYHARVVNFQHIDTDYLARQIQTATSLTEGDVKSVLESLSHFMGERLREGESVHLDGIGYFQIKLNSQEPISILTRPDFQGLCNFTATTAARHIRRLKEEKKLQNINTYYNPIYAPMPGYYGRAKL